jgi:hypothetical protein
VRDRAIGLAPDRCVAFALALLYHSRTMETARLCVTSVLPDPRFGKLLIVVRWRPGAASLARVTVSGSNVVRSRV